MHLFLLASLLLVAMPFVPSSFLLLVVRPGAPSSVLAPNSDGPQLTLTTIQMIVVLEIHWTFASFHGTPSVLRAFWGSRLSISQVSKMKKSPCVN